MPRGGQRDGRAQGTGSRRNRTEQSQRGQSRAVPAPLSRWPGRPLWRGTPQQAGGTWPYRVVGRERGGQARPDDMRQSCREIAAWCKRPVPAGDRCPQPVVGGAALPMGAGEHMGEASACLAWH